MRQRTCMTASVLGLLAAVASAAVDVPRVNDIQIDGNAADWADRGAKVDIMSPIAEKPFRADQFNATFRLGWDDRGLLVLVTVKDPVPTEAEQLTSLWQADSIELFVADKVGGKERLQFFVTPGLDLKFPQIRQSVVDHRSKPLAGVKADLKAARTKTADGYIMEMLMPWSALHREAESGDTLGFQIYVNSKDSDGPRRQVVFFDRADTAATSESMHELTLTRRSAAHIQVLAAPDWDRFRNVKVTLTGSADLAGKEVQVKLRQIGGDDTKVTARMQADAGRSTGTARLPVPTVSQAQVIASVDGEASPAVELTGLAAAKARALMEQPIIFRSAVFNGPEFPSAVFENPDFAETLIGPYQIHTTFYNAGFQQVTKAATPGRYGAVVEIKTDDGRVFHRFCTLYRTEKDTNWWDAKVPVQVEWPAEVGLDPIVVKEQSAATSGLLKRMCIQDALTHGGGADLLAGLRETKPGTPVATIMNDVEAIDRAWWVQFKRKMYGTDKRFTQPVARPHVAAKEAPVLRPGTDEQAGFKPATREKLDALLKQWAADSDQGFNACIARNGVVILDAAYGMRDGKPMTTHTQSWLASISKPLAASCMMMAVDQGIVSLDDTPDKFLPPFKNATGKQPMVRQLFTHTAGLWGHWGDEQNDFEEMIAEYLPNLKVGQKHEYNGASPALGCKILEQVSGESLPEFFARHLYGPLEMKDSVSTTASWRTYSTAADLAIFAQMLLNQGSYGNKAFFSPATFQQMLPHRLVKELSPDTTIEWGMGLTWMNDQKTVIGHGAASSSTLQIDPAKGLVITMARNSAGKNFDKYHPQMLKMIYDNLAEAPTTAPAK